MAPVPDIGLLARLHANSVYSYRTFATEPGDVVEGDGVVLVDTRAHESIENAAFVLQRPEDPRAMLEGVVRFFGARRVPWLLLVPPEAQDAVGREARALRLHFEGRFPAMVLDPLPANPPSLPRGVQLARAESRTDLETWESVFGRSWGFRSPPLPVDDRPRPDVIRYLVRVDGTPAGTAALIAHQGVAGIACVGTLPESRRRGAAEAVVRQAAYDGRSLGCSVSFLWATPRGYPIYRKIGYRTVFEYELWTPPGAPLSSEIREP